MVSTRTTFSQRQGRSAAKATPDDPLTAAILKVKRRRGGVGDKSATGFLDLPGELRNTIYGYAIQVVAPTPIVFIPNLVTKKRKTPPKTLRRFFEFRGLLGTCKQVREEYTSFLHEETSLKVTI
ncbi:hypothetical protein BDV96DRAFT_642795 [Lophiotrema nucula]|uniref:Uncharacterized protein n=1 Tax=Lophiotrema nucula TaxID=690887 RepID=A0A6A5ZMU3_9PLEO|nr:hypothetical protein BDV96DRAFT_642795 [Lophiotrema nucula]